MCTGYLRFSVYGTEVAQTRNVQTNKFIVWHASLIDQVTMPDAWRAADRTWPVLQMQLAAR